jgi:hypothetical protein
MIDAMRRDYLIAKALAYCVAAMERLPFYHRELSDQKDMQTLFDTIIIPEADREQLRREARERFPTVEPDFSTSLGTAMAHALRDNPPP